MAENLYISFLGTGNYGEVSYFPIENDSEKCITNRFIQVAVSELYCRPSWGSNYRSLVLCTQDAEKKHWNDLCPQLTNPELISIGEPYDINAMWELFAQISELVGEHDKIIFDITHSFRHIPMLLTIQIQYLMQIKKIELKGVYYGNFEARDRSQAPPRAPIIDLSPMFSLYQWTTAIHLFEHAGISDDLCELTQDKISPILRETRGQDENAQALRGLTKTIQEFTRAVQSVRSLDLVEPHPARLDDSRARRIGIDYDRAIKKPLEGIAENFIRPLAPVLSQLRDTFKPFKTGDAMNILYAANWARQHGQIQSAYTLLQEGCITILSRHFDSELIEILGTQATELEKRKAMSTAIHSQRTNRQTTNAGYKPEVYTKLQELGRKIKEVCPDLISNFDILTQRRNDLNHAGSGTDNPAHYESFVKDFERLYDGCSENIGRLQRKGVSL
ncbi:MAG: TIGR02221 family CRISPR-associated protein [Lentisphaerae bacterium]|nr:MAG: TIGR02221 family CRISPR-associated protein [Lentisphaerota bacterium]